MENYCLLSCDNWIDGQMQYPKILEDYPIDEDSGDALSPEQPGSQESQGSAASPGDVRTIEESPPLPYHLLHVGTLCWTSEKERNEKLGLIICFPFFFTEVTYSHNHFNSFPQAFFHQWTKG